MSVNLEQTATEMPSQTTEAVSRVEWAPVPRVNLLPPEIRERRRFRTIQNRLALIIVLVVAVIVAGTVWSQLQVGQAEDDLALTRNQASELQREQSQYAQVPLTLASVNEAKSARAAAMGDDVLWYRFLNDVALSMPSSVSLETMTVLLDTSTVDESASSAVNSPLAVQGIGTVSIGGTAGDYPSVAGWMDSIAEVTGVASVTLQTATREATTDGADSVVTFTAQLVVTDAALSHRYDQKGD